MKLNKSSSTITHSREIIDAVMESYIARREQTAAVKVAYHTWRYAPADERGRAFSEYNAALDGEELAAGVYQRLIEQAQARQGAVSP